MKPFMCDGLKVLYKKEISDHLRSKRFIIILILISIIGFASIYSAGIGIREVVNKENNDFIFLRLFTSSGDSIPSFVSFMSFLGPLIGLSLGFDLINGERARGTLSRLLAQPIYRDTVINGKFLAGTSILAIMVVSLVLAVGGLGIILIGIPPTLEEIGRLTVYLVLTILYIGIWYAISLMFSLIFKQTATSALAGIALWLFLTIFIVLIAGIVANGLYPVNDHPAIDTVLKHEAVKRNLSRISPITIYNEAMTTILNPGVRTMGLIMTSQLEGAIASSLPLGQSILLIWAHIVTMIAMIMVCFAISYILFMRQEIRAI
ncbi:ABC transporter permease [Paramaledivibacter caminithermalis]|uniref:ABC-2 type transport system permease protein n=1 Tax=Paramaledivibacter caminithermalis (strain DSM 15212 / CIP 107654 / DViRD3) TaxID=1121301 RepID=A0A1M6MDA7_PARC5|nr:ABC transporter permease subunit [Paramaledivibacter caminithermalis]SHJ81416.1 ABC-2 type transport system permease protein [Paramaledivibacter caminithermalis DSM 15212]